jgi:Periplasmic binding protein
MSSIVLDAVATRREFLALMGAAGLLSACSAGPASGPAVPATRTVQHPLGTTEVPVAPTRVVALDRRAALPHLLAIGVTPVGALTYESIIGAPFPPVVAEQARDVAALPTGGGADDPNLEAVAALQPDLLIGWTGGIEEAYPALSGIAPTVAVDVDFTDASVSLRAIGEASRASRRVSTGPVVVPSLGVKPQESSYAAEPRLPRTPRSSAACAGSWGRRDVAQPARPVSRTWDRLRKTR